MKRFLFLFSLLLIAAVSFAQAVADTIVLPDPLGPGATLPDFLNLYHLLEGAVIVILGYLHNYIPSLKFIPPKWVVRIKIILIGIVVSVIFVALGFTTGIGDVFVFLQAVGFYSLILKPVAPSPPANPKSEKTKR